jgi:hypothetical protein
MLYCPNCSAYQHDAGAEVCRKCGCDLSLSREPEPSEKREERKNVTDLSSYDPSVPCSICGSPTRDIRRHVDVTVEGNRISIYGVKLMGGEITKRTASRVEYEITGRDCPEGHLFYDDVGFRIRPICPLCYDPLMIYGNSLYSCSRCNKHFPMNDWPDPDPEATLRGEGWEQL